MLSVFLFSPSILVLRQRWSKGMHCMAHCTMADGASSGLVLESWRDDTLLSSIITLCKSLYYNDITKL